MNRTFRKGLLNLKSGDGSLPEALMLLHFGRRADTAGPLKGNLKSQNSEETEELRWFVHGRIGSRTRKVKLYIFGKT